MAYAVAGLKGARGYNGWRWYVRLVIAKELRPNQIGRIFIIEGSVTGVVAIVCYFFMVDWPETSTFLTPKDLLLLQHRKANDTGIARMDHMNKKALKRCLTDWKIWIR